MEFYNRCNPFTDTALPNRWLRTIMSSRYFSLLAFSCVVCTIATKKHRPRNITPLGPRGLMLHLAHIRVLGDGPVFKSPILVPTHDVSLCLLDSLCCAWSRTNFLRMLPPMPGIGRVVSHTTCGIERYNDSRRFDSKQAELLMDVRYRNRDSFHPSMQEL